MKHTIPLIFQKRHILPGGRIPIRVAPGPQMDAFKTALQHGDSFGVCMFDTDDTGHHFFGICTRVTVEDFDTSSKDGALIATVAGHEALQIESLDEDDNGFFTAHCDSLPQWPDTAVRHDQEVLADKLKIMFNKHPELDDLHEEKQYHNLSWLCQRWLELLPVPASEKQTLIQAPNCQNTYDYLMSIMQKPH